MSRHLSRGTIIARGCQVTIILAIVFLACMGLLVVAVSFAEAAPVVQATAVVCSPVGHAVLATPYSSVYIRPSPVAQGTPLGAVNDRTPRPIQSTRTGWIGLCPAGWVSAQYFVVSPVARTATPSPTRTNTPSNTPVVQAATPTRINSTPTVSEAVAVTINGVTYLCELPCNFWIEKP